MTGSDGQLPLFLNWLLGKMYVFNLREGYSGDIEEEYFYIRENLGKLRANAWIGHQAIRSLPVFLKSYANWSAAMFVNYIKIALRNLKKNKGYAFISVFGLAVGMACCLLVFFWVQDEYRYDRFHENKDAIFQVYSEVRYTSGRESIWMGSYYPLSKVLMNEIPEVADAVRYEAVPNILVKHGDKRLTDNTIGFADASFFDIFTFPFVKGDPRTAFSDRFSIVITEEMGRRYFGSEDPMGKTLNVHNQIDLLVTGIIEDVPQQSSLRFDCIVPFVLIAGGNEPTHWGGNPLTSFVLLHENVNLEEVAGKITGVVEKHHPRTSAKEYFHLNPLTRMHLYSPEGPGLIQVVVIFSLIVFFILIIACINFMNLNTARAATRAKEVGLRKVVGARRKNLVRQFLGESFLLSFIALLISIILVVLFLPELNNLLHKRLSIELLLNPTVIFAILGIVFFTGIMSGSYPALFLSSFQPVNVLKETTRHGGRSAVFRKILVIGQFTISIFLIIGTMAVFKQLVFIKNRDLGFDKDNLIDVSITGGIQRNFESVKRELLQNPNILNVASSFQHPANISSGVSAVDWDGKDPQESINFNWDVIDYDFIETLGIEVLAGRTFSKDFTTDASEAYIVNEEAVKIMGMDSPVGKRLSVFRNEGKIIGVVKNFHFQPLRSPIRPFVFYMNPGWSKNNMFIRIHSENYSETMQYIKDVYEKYEQDYPINIHFFTDSVMRRSYQTERMIIKIAGYFTFLAILISCLGLFGLASFLAERRTKEIGVRKVLGASVSGVFIMLSKDFTKWVLLANIIAWPAAFFAIKKSLEMYAYRIGIGIEIFLLSGLAAFVIALLTVSYQTIRVAHANPADSLRYE